MFENAVNNIVNMDKSPIDDQIRNRFHSVRQVKGTYSKELKPYTLALRAWMYGPRNDRCFDK